MGTIVADTTARAATHNPTVLVERSLLGLLLALMLVPDQARRQLEPDEMEQPEHRMILQYLLAWQSRGNYDYEMFRETLPEEVRAHADGLRGLAIPPPADGKLSVAIEFHLARLRRFRILAQLNRTRELLPDLDSSDQSTAIASLGTLNQRLLELQHQLEHLSQIILQAGPSTDQIAYAVTGRAPTAQGTIDHDSGRL